MSTTTTSTTSTSTSTTTIDIEFRHFSETVELKKGLNKISVKDQAGFVDSIFVIRK